MKLLRAQIEDQLRRARVDLARRSLAEFFRQAVAAGVVHGLSKLEWGRHLDLICEEVQLHLEGWLVAYGHGSEEMIARQREAWERTGATWEDGEPDPWLRYPLVPNHIYNLPPSTLKSTIVMVVANAWIWLLCPTFAFGATSGVDSNVWRDARAARDIVESAWYRETFGIAWETWEVDEDGKRVDVNQPEIAIRRDNSGIQDWATSAGGRRVSRTLLTGFTGAHVDGIFIDDPDDADRVWSEAERIRPQNRFSRAVENRVNDERRSLRAVLQQRVHPEDFTFYLLSLSRWSPQNPKGWALLCLAAEFGLGPPDAPAETPYGLRDWRTDTGETLHAMLSPGVLADKRAKLPSYEAQYNQNPARRADGMFLRGKARWFVWEGTDTRALRRRPEGTIVDRFDLPPVTVPMSAARDWTLSVDAANSLNPAPGAKVSAVGLIVGARHEGKLLVVDDRTKVLGVSATYMAIYRTLAMWPIGLVLVELKAMGAGVVDELTRAVRRGWYIDPDTDQRIDLRGPDGRSVRCEIETVTPAKGEDKVQRANASLPAWERGDILLLDGAEWLYPTVDDQRRTMDEGFFEEVCSFPASRRKDRMDALSQLEARYRQGDGDASAAMRRLAGWAARRMVR